MTMSNTVMKRKRSLKKTFFVLSGIVLFAFLLYFFGSGFRRIGSVYIYDFSISQDDRQITIETGVYTSIGYTRAVKAHEEGGEMILDFYSAFGGINGNIGTKHTFTIPLSEDTEMIAIRRDQNSYQEALRKDENGIWHLIN